MRSYLSGAMATAYVPGRAQSLKLVFTSSLPHVVVSTVLFAFLALFINVCYLRSDTEQFTLFSVAAALAHSNVPAVCEDIKYADRGRGAMRENVALKSLEGRRIRLANNGGPGHSLSLE
jgi:type III secretory pathway component EscS